MNTNESHEVNRHPQEGPLPAAYQNGFAENSQNGNDAGISERIRYAGFWMRFWSYLLDLVVIGSISRIIASTIFRLLEVPSSDGLFSVETITSAVIFYLYFVLMTKYMGQTLGKMVFGIKVINLRERHLDWRTVLFREWIGRFISSTIVIGYIIPAFHPKKQGLHDVFADTAVIHTDY